MKGGFVILRFDDSLEVQGECPYCPIDEVHYHQLNPFTGEVERDFTSEPQP